MSGSNDKDRVTGREDSARSFFKPFAAAYNLRDDSVIKEVRAAAGAIEVYLVGGVLRNLCLSVPAAPDYDFVLSGDTGALSGEAARRLKGTRFALDEEAGSYRVVARAGEREYTLDFSAIKGGSITEDLMARDFTVNAMALSLNGLFGAEAPVVIDPSGGMEDCAGMLLRMTSERVFDEDALRAMRAIRLSAQYGLSITEETFKTIRGKSALLAGVSAERVRDELAALFATRRAAEGVVELFDTGIISVILPEATGWADLEGYDLRAHALKTLAEAESLISGISEETFPGFSSKLKEAFDGTTGSIDNRTIFRLAAFFHDFGKPYTLSREAGRLRFIGHDAVGAEALKEALTRLRFSRRVAGELANLVRNHHRLFMLASLEEPTNRAKAHFFRATGDGAGLFLICLALADARATRGGEDIELYKLALEMMRFYHEVYLKKRPRPLLNGKEIMEAFGVSEGPHVGRIIARINEGVEAGEIRNRREAISHIKKWLKESVRG